MQNFQSKFKNGFNGANYHGGYTFWDRRLCFQSHDDYYECIDKMTDDSNLLLIRYE